MAHTQTHPRNTDHFGGIFGGMEGWICYAQKIRKQTYPHQKERSKLKSQNDGMKQRIKDTNTNGDESEKKDRKSRHNDRRTRVTRK